MKRALRLISIIAFFFFLFNLQTGRFLTFSNPVIFPAIILSLLLLLVIFEDPKKIDGVIIGAFVGFFWGLFSLSFIGHFFLIFSIAVFLLKLFLYKYVRIPIFI